MSRKLTFWDIPSVISLPESGSGAMPCAVPDGPIPALSGREAALASLSARQAKERGLLTSGTFGPRSTISSASADLQSCLASRLQAVTALHGSTLYKLTWKRRVTPAGRWIPALRASVRRTSGKDCIGWPTPKAAEAGPDFAIHTRKGSRHVITDGSTACGMGNAVSAGLEGHTGHGHGEAGRQDAAGSVTEAGNSGGMENSCGHGRLCGYGNAIVAPQAEAFIRAYLELEQDNLQRNTVENK